MVLVLPLLELCEKSKNMLMRLGVPLRLAFYKNELYIAEAFKGNELDYTSFESRNDLDTTGLLE